MPLTLDDAEKLLAKQADEIKDLRAKMETTKSDAEYAALAKRLDGFVAQFDELHEKYAKLTPKDPDATHHCFWCP